MSQNNTEVLNEVEVVEETETEQAAESRTELSTEGKILIGAVAAGAIALFAGIKHLIDKHRDKATDDNDEEKPEKPKKSFWKKLMFWKKDPEPDDVEPEVVNDK